MKMSWSRFTIPAFLVALPALAEAQTATEQAFAFVDKLNEIILFPTIALLTAVAFLVFLWGVAQYLMNADNDQARAQGVQHITWGVIGLVIMLSAFTILRLATNTVGLNDELDCVSDPTATGCSTVFPLPSQTGGGTPTGNPGGTPTGNPGGTPTGNPSP